VRGDRDELLTVHPDLARREITGIRLILGPADFHIDRDIIGNLISDHVPRLRAQLQPSRRIPRRLLSARTNSRTFVYPCRPSGHVPQRCAARPSDRRRRRGRTGT
jgi:hypothetical protein